MSDLDLTLLTEYSSRMLDYFLPAFPNEEIFLLENSENYYESDKYRHKGAWIIEWLCPAGGLDWNIQLRSTIEGTEEQLTVCWGNDHIHFGSWTNTKPDEEAEDCLRYIAEIMNERIFLVSFYNESGLKHAQICRPDEIQYIKASFQATCYKIKSWKGSYDKTI